jgi:hypothetical protein
MNTLRSQSTMFRASRMHGDPHQSNGKSDKPEEQGFYFCIDSHDRVALGHLAGYLTAKEFDYIAERIGVPTLAEALCG